jgi:F-type H+-transporting ATPase subunit b
MGLAGKWMTILGGGMVLLSASGRALAEMAEAGGAHEEPGLFTGDIGNVIWTVLIFVLLLMVLGKYAWRPLLDALNRREQFIRDTLDNARKERNEAERALAEYRGLIAKSKSEAQAIIDQGRKDAEVARQQLHQQAQSESEQMIARARQEISLTKQSALHELQNVAADLSVNVASKIIQRNLSVGDQQHLVEESLRQLANS